MVINTRKSLTEIPHGHAHVHGCWYIIHAINCHNVGGAAKGLLTWKHRPEVTYYLVTFSKTYLLLKTGTEAAFKYAEDVHKYALWYYIKRRLFR